MEDLLNELGPGGFFALVGTPGVVLLLIGTLWRGWARRRSDRLERALGQKRALREVVRGGVTVRGTWRTSEGQNGLVEDAGAQVFVERPLGVEEIADGAAVTVVGVATRQVDDPSAGYRAAGKVWVIDTRVGGLVSALPHELEDQAARAKRHVSLGASVIALGVLLFVTGSVIGYRASTQAMYAEPFESAR
jgi:hypothetical protein